MYAKLLVNSKLCLHSKLESLRVRPSLSGWKWWRKNEARLDPRHFELCSSVQGIQRFSSIHQVYFAHSPREYSSSQCIFEKCILYICSKALSSSTDHDYLIEVPSPPLRSLLRQIINIATKDKLSQSLMHKSQFKPQFDWAVLECVQ